MMMKLSLRNAKRSLKDYLIYFITMVLSFSLVFSFYLIVFSTDINELSSSMENFRLTIFFVSGIVFFVISYLINYTIRFLFLKRSKEFGIYLLLGIQKKKVSNLFLLENLMLGLFALIVSFGVGFLFSQFFKIIIMSIFELPYFIHLEINLEAFFYTIVYFGFIYLFVLWKSSRRFKKMKIYDLLYFDRQNEKQLFQKEKHPIVIFLFSLFFGILGSFLLFHQLGFKFMEGASFLVIVFAVICFIISIYGITISIIDFVLHFMLKRNTIKYRKTNLFLTRIISSKVRSMGFTLGTLSFLLFLTFVALNFSNVFQSVFENQSKSCAPYDVIFFDEEERYPDYLSFIDETLGVRDSIEYSLFTNHSSDIRSHISDGSLGYVKYDVFLKEGDYNKLLEMRGFEKISLAEDEFFIHSYRDVLNELKDFFENNPNFTLLKENLKLKGISGEDYSHNWANGSSYVIVIPDDIASTFFKTSSYLSVNTQESTSESFSNAIRENFPPVTNTITNSDGTTQTYIVNSFITKGAIIAENRSFITIIAFSLLYLAFIFTAVVGTILAIQSLSDSEKYKHHYKILSQLGLTSKEIQHIIWKQLAILFFFPVIYPIILSIWVSICVNQLFSFLLTNDYSIYLYLGISIILFLVILFVYFLATYFSCKNNILE